MFAVNHEVSGHANRQGHGSNDVLNHAVSSRFVQFSVLGEGSDMLFTEIGSLSDKFSTLIYGQLVQSFDSTVLNRHGASRANGGGCVP